MGAAEATGKGIEIMLRGQTYQLSPITVDDLAEFEKYIRDDRLKAVTEAAKDFPPDERREMVMAALLVPQSVLIREISSIRGARFLIHRALLPNYPDMTLTDIGKLCGVDNLSEVMAFLDNMYGEQRGPLAETAEDQSVG